MEFYYKHSIWVLSSTIHLSNERSHQPISTSFRLWLCPSSHVTTTFATNAVASSTTDPQGSFGASFVVPSLSPGSYTIQSRDDNNNLASSTFVINGQCVPPWSGDWNMTSSCALSNNATAPANVIIPPNVVLTIPNGFTLTINFGVYHLLIKPGGQLYIQPYGKISS